MKTLTLACALAGSLALATTAAAGPPVRPGDALERLGDEIVVCGRLFHTTTPVVLWTDPGGYDAYRTERRFAPPGQAGWAASKALLPRGPNRYGTRTKGLSPEAAERVREGLPYEALRDVVDQFVIHFDARGTSRTCFEVLHDIRGLSVQFMLDLDGTIYQTLDVKEAAWHATIANNRSIGVEVANIGAYPDDPAVQNPLADWYRAGADGKAVLTVPGGAEKARLRRPNLTLRPDRDAPVVGEVQGKRLRQYDYTPEQYEALARLTATLCTLFPKIACDYPRDPATGALALRKLPDAELANYRGLLGHYHVQSNKVDPGPAFQWDRLVCESRALMAR